MSGRMRWRIGMVLTTVLLVGFFAVCNFLPESVRAGSALLPDRGVRLGLDLRGGIHWVLGVELEDALSHELSFLRSRLQERIDEANLLGVEAVVEEQEIRISASSEDARAQVQEFVDDTGVLRAVGADTGLAYALDTTWQQEVRERAMQQVLEVLRNRITDPATGILESVVTRQGDDRVLVQVPGGEVDRQQLRDLLKVTGKLEFKIVEDQAASRELLEAKYPDGLPEGTEIVFEVDPQTGNEVLAYLVQEEAAITGDYLDDARVGFDNRQRPIVNFQFTPEGGEIFGDLTEANVERLLAIILDGKVRSAPVIRTRISMRGQIEGRFTGQEAADLAVVLRAGSLSVPIVVEEERTVGPALGADSIRRGVRASIAGLVLVVLFAAFYYRGAGAFASVALAVNLVLILGLMSLPEVSATLTLPGIAGLVLTVGMAIDANVIIFERIREELRSGKAPRAAVDTGFQKARWTILDANITTLITAIILLEFGTGPIQGFAVTLSIGILTSVFAALVVTRLLFDVFLSRAPRTAQLSI